jgi:hypothetical protein
VQGCPMALPRNSSTLVYGKISWMCARYHSVLDAARRKHFFAVRNVRDVVGLKPEVCRLHPLHRPRLPNRVQLHRSRAVARATSSAALMVSCIYTLASREKVLNPKDVGFRPKRRARNP